MDKTEPGSSLLFDQPPRYGGPIGLWVLSRRVRSRISLMDPWISFLSHPFIYESEPMAPEENGTLRVRHRGCPAPTSSTSRRPGTRAKSALVFKLIRTAPTLVDTGCHTSNPLKPGSKFCS